jgi:hypothetical protein
LVGGECNFYGCIPSKSLLWPMTLRAEVSRMPGLELAGPIDAGAVLARRDEFVGHYGDAPQVSWVESVPVGFVRGQGRLAGPLRVEVTAPDGGIRVLRATHAVVPATGSDPWIPEVPGLREARPVDEPGSDQHPASAQTAGRDRRRARRLPDVPGAACPRHRRDRRLEFGVGRLEFGVESGDPLGTFSFGRNQLQLGDHGAAQLREH